MRWRLRFGGWLRLLRLRRRKMLRDWRRGAGVRGLERTPKRRQENSRGRDRCRGGIGAIDHDHRGGLDLHEESRDQRLSFLRDQLTHRQLPRAFREEYQVCPRSLSFLACPLAHDGTQPLHLCTTRPMPLDALCYNPFDRLFHFRDTFFNIPPRNGCPDD